MGNSLHDLQVKFVTMVMALLDFAFKANYEVTLGEAYRTPAQAAANAKAGIGISRSLHCDRLAIDINLFKNEKYLTDTDDYKLLGEFWEKMGGNWGGRFIKIKDGNHFSLSCGDGRK